MLSRLSIVLLMWVLVLSIVACGPDSVDPPISKLNEVDSLLSDSKFNAAQHEIVQLLESYPLSAELHYRLIKALTLETRLITSGNAPENANSII